MPVRRLRTCREHSAVIARRECPQMFRQRLGDDLRQRHRAPRASLQPPEDELLRLDTTSVTPETTADTIYTVLMERGQRP